MASSRPFGARWRDGAWTGAVLRVACALCRLAWRGLAALFAGGRALYRSPPVAAARRRLRAALARLARRAWDLAGELSRWLHRRFGRTITVGLAGPAFLGFALTPDNSALYTGINWSGDLDCLALNIYHEARGEPEQGKLAVGHVVMNRVFDRRFPATVCAVVTQGGQDPRRGCQFSWWCDGRTDLPRDKRAWYSSKLVADQIFAGASRDPTGGALWYHADHVQPFWRKAMVEGPKIGQHIFYLSPKNP